MNYQHNQNFINTADCLPSLLTFEEVRARLGILVVENSFRSLERDPVFSLVCEILLFVPFESPHSLYV